MPAYTPYPAPTPWINQPTAPGYSQSQSVQQSGSPQGFVVNPYTGGSNPTFASPADVAAVAPKPYVSQINTMQPKSQVLAATDQNKNNNSGSQSNYWSDQQNKGYLNGTWYNDKNQWLNAGGSMGAPSGPDASQVRSEISSAYDGYLSQLDNMMGGFDTQKNNQNQIVENQYNQSVTDLGASRDSGMRDLNMQRTKNQEQQVKSLRDIADNIRNLFQTGNVMLGTKGAGDSSAANQYSYAVTRLGSRERGNVMDQTRSIENDIGGREAKLNEIYTTEKSRLKSERDNQILNIANQFEQARQQLLQAKAQGSLEKGLSLANLSKELLNQATTRMMQIDADMRSKANMLDQWAMNNAKTIGDLKNNLAAVAGYKAPQVQANQIVGTPQFDASGNLTASLRPATGYGYAQTQNDQQTLKTIGNSLF